MHGDLLVPATAPDAVVTYGDHAVGLGRTRARILAMLRDLGAATAATDVAERLGTHPNTARFHLEALAAAGLAERVREDRSVPGRPRVRYVASAVPTRAAPPRSYRLLAEILAAHLATQPDPEGAATAAGAAYGRAAVQRAGGPADQSGVVAVVDGLGAMGFESRAVEVPTGVRIDVTSCPFLEVATGHLPVVCAVHRGLMEGLLGELGSPITVDRLDPLVEPGLCVAHLVRPAPGMAATREASSAR